MSVSELALPSIDEITKENPAWLDEAVSADEISRLTGIRVGTLATWRSRGGGPRYMKLGSVVRYRRRAVFEWMVETERPHTGIAGQR